MNLRVSQLVKCQEEMYPGERSGDFRIQDAEEVKLGWKGKNDHQTWTEQRKEALSLNLGWNRDTGKASCKINRKHCFCQGREQL